MVAPIPPDDGEFIHALSSERHLHRHLAAAVSIADFERRIRDLLQLIGIDAWVHTDINTVIGVLDVFGTWPKELAARYAREEFHRDDLALRHMLISDQPLFIHRVFDFVSNAPFKCGLFSRNLEIQKLLYRYGMNNIFSIPIVTDQCRSVFTVATNKTDRSPFEAEMTHNLKYLRTLGTAIGRIGRKKFTTNFHGAKDKLSIPIPHKPLLLLEQLATKDLTLNEVAEVLGISISTANQQISAAKNAFGTNTTHGTVVAAILNGYIVLDI